MLQHFAITAPSSPPRPRAVPTQRQTRLTLLYASLSDLFGHPAPLPCVRSEAEQHDQGLHRLLATFRIQDAAGTAEMDTMAGPRTANGMHSRIRLGARLARLDAIFAGGTASLLSGVVRGEARSIPATSPRVLYELRPFLEAPLLRRLFYPNEFYVPPTTATTGASAPETSSASSASRFSLSAADRQALAHFFPAYHCDRVYATVEPFVAHCRTDAHMFLCEGLPLTPLAVVQKDTLIHTLTAHGTRPCLPEGVTSDVAYFPLSYASQPPPTMSGDDAFYDAYQRLHGVLFHYLSRNCFVTHTTTSDDHAEGAMLCSDAVARAVADALGAVLSAAILACGHTSEAGGCARHARQQCTFVAEQVHRWWGGGGGRGGVHPTLRRALLTMCGLSDALVRTHLLAPLCCHVAQHLVAQSRSEEIERVYAECCRSPITHHHASRTESADARSRRCRKRPRDGEPRFTGMFDVLLSLTLCDPLHRVPLIT